MMRVLVLHSRYLSGALSGENRVVEDETRLLREAGHEVTVWDPTPEHTSGAALLRTGLNAIWSLHAVRKIGELIGEGRPDVVHCHNLFPELSPAIIRAISSRELPLVMTLHNYRSLCLPATFVRDGRVCEDCLGRLPWPGVVHGCYRGSRSGSGVLAASLSLHRTIGTFERATHNVAVSEFVKNKHVEAGWSPERITVKSNFAWPSPRRDGPGDYFLYAGRLSPEKGVAVILETFTRGGPRLVVAGDGPLSEDLRRIASPAVEFRGALSPREVGEVVRGARALLVPSICYEGQPRGILEAYAAGVPVIATDIGGIPEIVKDDGSGFLIPPDSSHGWREAVEHLLDDAEAERLGDGAHRLWRERYTPQMGLEGLESAYQLAVSRVRA